MVTYDYIELCGADAFYRVGRIFFWQEAFKAYDNHVLSIHIRYSLLKDPISLFISELNFRCDAKFRVSQVASTYFLATTIIVTKSFNL